MNGLRTGGGMTCGCEVRCEEEDDAVESSAAADMVACILLYDKTVEGS